MPIVVTNSGLKDSLKQVSSSFDLKLPSDPEVSPMWSILILSLGGVGSLAKEAILDSSRDSYYLLVISYFRVSVSRVLVFLFSFYIEATLYYFEYVSL
jgi:hypothetical protein